MTEIMGYEVSLSCFQMYVLHVYSFGHGWYWQFLILLYLGETGSGHKKCGWCILCWDLLCQGMNHF